ncbi:hypothetical protein P4T20_09330 [Aneurinibacillus thermoaerophilus]|uniref:hypothetical protein n=1 Tax=Aneurinibacillus thermoaerophilus TaxID=143495 RepID=UPI001587B2CD|nr:hypothetical protein [Aneurinibacillus thermoaerophilus]MED0679485.1 hypothetical protein [Aneurinibacillus thermoaerophilus]
MKRENKAKSLEELQTDAKKCLSALIGKKVTVTVETNQEKKEMKGILKKVSAEIMGNKHQCLHFYLDINTQSIGTMEVSSVYEDDKSIVILCEPDYARPGHYNKIITVTK